MTEHRIIIEQETPLQRKVFWVMFFLILTVMFWKWAVGILFVAGLTWGIWYTVRNSQLERAAMLARADQQRTWYDQQDPRFLHGPDWKAPDA